MINIEKEKTIFFTGHRPDMLGVTKKDARARLKTAVQRTYSLPDRKTTSDF